jgi:hypothetical protein
VRLRPRHENRQRGQRADHRPAGRGRHHPHQIHGRTIKDAKGNIKGGLEYMVDVTAEDMLEMAKSAAIVSAGFDGHMDDPISKTHLTTRWYATVTRLLRRLSLESCQGRLLMVLEGGYNPTALQASVITVLDALLEPDPPVVGIMPSDRAARLIAGHPAKQHWTF